MNQNAKAAFEAETRRQVVSGRWGNGGVLGTFPERFSVEEMRGTEYFWERKTDGRYTFWLLLKEEGFLLVINLSSLEADGAFFTVGHHVVGRKQQQLWGKTRCATSFGTDTTLL